ncbi:MAG: DUF6489 family protein [Mangrovicoccus sp.]
MKARIELELSPVEARELMGLPDVRKLQEAWLEKMSSKMEADLENLTPDAILQNWMKAASGNAEWMSAFMNMPNFMSSGSKSD